VDPTPITITLAPSASTAKASASNPIEHLVGCAVAAAAGAIAEALAERQAGRLTSATRTRGGNLICELVRLRQLLIVDFPDFDSIARTHGLAALRACDASAATANILIDEVFDLLRKVSRVSLN